MDVLNPGFMHPLHRLTISALFMGALALSVFFAPLAGWVAFKAGAVDQGGGRRVHTGSIPRLGGVGIFFSCFIVLTVYFLAAPGHAPLLDRRITGLVLATSLVFLVGVYDDIKGLRTYKKLFFEILAGCILYCFGFRAGFLSNPFGGAFDLSLLSLPLTVLWVIVVTNAVNLIDGLDGVAAGTGIFVALTMLFVSNDPLTEAVALVLTGSLAGFLFFNYPPARIFMGDSGSLFIGFCLAALSLTASNKSATAFGIMAPMTAFAFPLMDMAYAVLRRYYRGLPLGEADKEHIHHKLLAKGFSKRAVMLVLYGINFFLMLLVLLIMNSHHFSPLWYFIAALAVAVGGLRYLDYVEFRPFLNAAIGNHIFTRKRKYHLHLLRAFQRDIKKMKPGHAGEIYARIAELLEAMDFASAEIYLDSALSAGEKYVWLNPGKKSFCPVCFSFPIECEGSVYGKIKLKKNIQDDVPIHCIGELMSALSSVMYIVLEDKTKPVEGRAVAVSEDWPDPEVDKVVIPMNRWRSQKKGGSKTSSAASEEAVS